MAAVARGLNFSAEQSHRKPPGGTAIEGDPLASEERVPGHRVQGPLQPTSLPLLMAHEGPR